MSYTHFIEGTEVHPSGDWEIKHEFPTGCIFSRRVFSGELTFGNILHNGESNDYDLIMDYADCQRLDYEIKCEGETFWEGYLNHTIGYDTDEDNCLITTEPLLSDAYDCFVTYGDTPYSVPLAGNTIINVYQRGTDVCPYTINGSFWGIGIYDILDYLVNNINRMNCEFAGDFVSSFFWIDDYPDTTAPTLGRNYITDALPTWHEIYFSTISKVRNAMGSTVATGDIYDITFNMIMQVLRDMFSVYWYLDDNGDFRIEHLHYFEHDFAERDHTLLPDDINLTTQLDKFTGKPLGYGKNKWKYLEQNKYNEEHLEFIDAENEDFIGLPIIYDEECTYNWPKQNVRTVDLNNVMTDIQMLIDDPDSVTSEGLFITACWERDLHEDNNLITGWTNNNWATFNVAGAVVNSLIEANPSPPIIYCYSNDVGAVAVGTTFTLCYYVPVGGFVGAPFVGLYTGAGVQISTATHVLATGAWTQVTLVSNAISATSYVRIVGDRPGGGDALGNGALDPAYFNLDLQEDKWYVQWAVGAITAAWHNNCLLSTANLMENYWLHGRVLIDGDMNDGNVVLFDSVKPDKLQVPISIPKCCGELHWNTYIVTDLGNGYPYSIIEKKDTYEVELLYP